MQLPEWLMRISTMQWFSFAPTALAVKAKGQDGSESRLSALAKGMKNILCVLSRHRYEVNYQRPLISFVCSRCGYRVFELKSKSQCDDIDRALLQGHCHQDNIGFWHQV